ncbi:unnamed protein product [Peniophora sp. CBMAI 1063]|nr:unnamed protein product [Peniophora sp. CBMAI 1063]
MSRPSFSSLRPPSQLAVPDLLLDFPTPPSYIPPSPSGNPPPSLPPSGPLPPVPGPSPISQQDLSVIQRSRISIGSFTSRRSASPNGSVHTFGNPHHHGRKDSQSSMRSYASSASLAVPGSIARPPLRSPRSPHSPRAEAISEGDEDSSSIAHTSLADIPRLTPSPLPPPTNDELANVDMHDLPSDDDDDGPLDPRALHMQMRAARSKSTTHKSRLGTMDTPRSRRPSSPTRAASPDVATMIATTPRPRRPSSPSSSRPRSRVRSAGSTLSSSSSGGRGRYASSTFSHSSLPYAASVASTSRAGTEDWNEDSFIDDYGTVISGGHGLGTLDDASNYDEAEATERVGTEEDGGDDSDSSLDLHTPLPNLMLRHGMLSPNSKLLVGASRAGTPADRPGSTLSVNSAMTKSGHYRDDRDTLQRRVRHRDGKLLRAGMGLTTGLGWSDSEDEDAPSALTRRLSNLALARQNSTRSLGSSTSRTPSRPSRLTRSVSSDAQAMPTRSRTKSRPSAPPSSYAKPPISAPPLPSSSSSQSLRPSDAGRTRSLGDEPSLDLDDDEGASTSTGSTSLRTPDGFELGYPPPRTRPWDREKSLPPLPRSLSRGPSVLSRQPSTASTTAPSLRRQPSSKGLRSDVASAATQIGQPASGTPALTRKPSAKSVRPQPSTKSLVPKPSTGSLRHKSSAKSLRQPSKYPDTPLDTSRTTPAVSYTASAPVSPYSNASTSSYASSPASQYARRASEPDERIATQPTTPRTPRPLLTASLSSPNILADLQAQPVPPLPPKATSIVGGYHRPGRISGLPRTTSQPTLADGEKPRPRTGTGMVYRKSSGTSRMPTRPPPPANALGYSGPVMI